MTVHRAEPSDSRPTLAPARSDAEASVPESLEAFVATHYRRLVRLAAIVCVDRGDAQDAVQNALERAWRHRAGLREPHRMKPWLDSIVVRESIRLNGRARSVIRGLTRRLTGPDDPDAAYLPADAIGFMQELKRLPAAQRAVVALHYEAGYSVAETAELVAAPVETVRSRLRLARERLRREHPEYRSSE